MRQQHKHTLFRSISITAGVFVGLFLSEILTRMILFTPKGRAATENEFRKSAIPELMYEYVPGHSYEWRYGKPSLLKPGFTVPVCINSMGLRNAEITVPKPPDIRRILVLGDSFTVGLGVPEKEVYPRQLETILNEKNRFNPRIEVINAGVAGYNTVQELAFLKYRGMLLEPDFIILGFHPNDIRGAAEFMVEDRGMLQTIGGQPGNLNLSGRLFDAEKKRNFWEWILEESHLMRRISGIKFTRKSTVLTEYTGKVKRRKTKEALLEINRCARKTGIPFLVVVFSRIKDSEPQIELTQNYKWVLNLCEENSIPCLPLDSAVNDIPSKELRVHPQDQHPNGRAHHLFARSISEHIVIDGKILHLIPFNRSHPVSFFFNNIRGNPILPPPEYICTHSYRVRYI